MDKGIELLKHWLENYVAMKDMIKKEIVKTEFLDGIFSVKVKTGNTKKYALMNLIPDDYLLENHISIVTFNTKHNFDWLMAKWNKLATYDDVNVFFINPNSQPDNRWIISPYVHNKIANKETFKTGLTSLFNSVDVLTAKEIETL